MCVGWGGVLFKAGGREEGDHVGLGVTIRPLASALSETGEPLEGLEQASDNLTCVLRRGDGRGCVHEVREGRQLRDELRGQPPVTAVTHVRDNGA